MKKKKNPRFFVPLNAWKEDGIRWIRFSSGQCKTCKIFKREKCDPHVLDRIGWSVEQLVICCKEGNWKEITEEETAFY